jgi:hypothetical protein
MIYTMQWVDETTRQFGEEAIDTLHGKTLESKERGKQLAKYILSLKRGSIDFILPDLLRDIPTSNATYTNVRTILSSLFLPEMEHRELDIPQAFVQTCDWVLHEPRRSNEGALLWSSFPGWLRGQSSDIYWITGKPGAGKSTLMKFTAKDPQLLKFFRFGGTRESTGHSTQRFTVARYFSWISGTNTLQKSHVGLLRTLIHQCVESFDHSGLENLLHHVFPNRWYLLQLFGDKVGFPVWEQKELMAAFEALISFASSADWELLFLIDGLDEFNEDHSKLVGLLHNANMFPNVKICTSSRPWNIFKDAYKQTPCYS